MKPLFQINVREAATHGVRIQNAAILVDGTPVWYVADDDDIIVFAVHQTVEDYKFLCRLLDIEYTTHKEYL